MFNNNNNNNNNGGGAYNATGVVRGAKLQSNRHNQQTNTQLFTGRMPLLTYLPSRHPTNRVTTLKGWHLSPLKLEKDRSYVGSLTKYDTHWPGRTLM